MEEITHGPIPLYITNIPVIFFVVMWLVKFTFFEIRKSFEGQHDRNTVWDYRKSILGSFEIALALFFIGILLHISGIHLAQ